MSKGSKQRPRQVPRKQYDDNWDLAFGKKEDKSEEQDTRKSAQHQGQ